MALLRRNAAVATKQTPCISLRSSMCFNVKATKIVKHSCYLCDAAKSLSVIFRMPLNLAECAIWVLKEAYYFPYE